MVLKDLFITPVFLALLTLAAYAIRPSLTNDRNRKYFIPALWVRFVGAISVGLIYQFYYGGAGDTFMYFDLGSKYVWKAFLDNPVASARLIFGEMEFHPETFQYQSQIFTFGDAASYFVVRIAGLFDLITFHTYSATACIFAFMSFFGGWFLFRGFEKLYPSLTRYLAYGILFVPSVFFWGSGLLKDTITLSAIGILFYALVEIIIFRRNVLTNVFMVMVASYVLYLVKIYIIMSFVPALFLWIYIKFQDSIKIPAIKFALAPVLLVVLLGSSYYSVRSFSADSHRYSFDKLLVTAEETAKWNYYVSVIQGGSGYTLGDYDFTPSGLARKFIPAVLTTIFRPMIVEVRNPVMLLSALENLVILLLIGLTFKHFFKLQTYRLNPVLILCFVFCVLFSFATGVTTYNFGALARYRIPMLPFLFAGLVILRYGNSAKEKIRNLSSYRSVSGHT